ncbi:MAG: PEPxxWA-CTERM sorting domain-containing protein [Phenylobacterium sp.]|nr:PEPxxWA-CTERM sorting domain-containing protein [Phenylobacterium sp.]
MRRLALVAAAAAVLCASEGVAAEIVPLSYSTSPGAHGLYPDASGVELIDGVIADRHFNVDTAPYAAWRNVNPTITFSFDATKTFEQLVVWVDDFDGTAGVYAPASISAVIDGQTYSSFTIGAPLDAGYDYAANGFGDRAPGGGTPFTLDLNGAQGSSVALTLLRDGEWTFVSEVDFFESAVGAVPEPTTWALMIAGFGLAGASLRRRRFAPS